MINFEHHGIKVKCKPERAMQYRAAINKPPKAKTVSEKRDYPQWHAEMSTAEYLQKYLILNDRRRMIQCGHDCPNIYNIPAMYDGTTAEVLEELDPEYKYTPTIKRKTATAAQLRAALAGLIDAIEEGDPSVIAYHAISAKGLL